jgi:hypothetical protein
MEPSDGMGRQGLGEAKLSTAIMLLALALALALALPFLATVGVGVGDGDGDGSFNMGGTLGEKSETWGVLPVPALELPASASASEVKDHGCC